MPQSTCGVAGCPNAHRAKGLCSTHYNRANYTREQRHSPRTATCHVCGASVIKNGGRGRRPVCSMYCRWFLQNPVLSCPIPESHPAHPRWAEPGRLLPVVWLPPAPRRSRPRPARKRWVAGNCRRCAAPFVAVWLADQSARYCSAACVRSDAKVRRRALKRSAYVEDVWRTRVFERDGWRCQLCRKKVDRAKAVPHPRAPVLDHIVPLAEGGTHEPRNVQCAHFMCNSIKGHRGGGEQLLLIG